MESSSHVTGSSEGESGWTSYLVSHIHGNNSDDNDDNDDTYSIYMQGANRTSGISIVDGGGGDSDDSMVSDASSGPIRSVTSSSKKSNNQASKAKQYKQNNKPRNEGRTKSASSYVHRGSNVRKAK